MDVEIGVEDEGDARSAERHPTSTDARIRPFRKTPESIRIIDISPKGCGFESRMPFQEGMMVLLYLPGLEPWAATVKWWEDGRGGAEFVRPLHPAVAQRFVSRING